MVRLYEIANKWDLFLSVPPNVLKLAGQLYPLYQRLVLPDFVGENSNSILESDFSAIDW